MPPPKAAESPNDGCNGRTAGPYIFGAQQPAHGQALVADRLGIEPEPRAAGQQAIVGIALQQFRRDPRRLPVGGRRDQQADHMLDVPVRSDQFRGQIIEQFGVRRQIALRAEILARGDQSRCRRSFPKADWPARGPSADCSHRPATWPAPGDWAADLWAADGRRPARLR